MFPYQNSTMDIEPTFKGYMEDENDALLLIQATIDGSLRHIPRRPYEIESTHLIVSGNIFVFIEEISGIKRWTDGVSWSPSRISGKFLVYKEIDKDQVSNYSKRRATAGIKLPPLMLNIGGRDGSLQDFTSGRLGKFDDGFSSPQGLNQTALIKKTISVCLKRAGSSSFENFHIVSYYTLDDIKHNRLITPKSSIFLRDVRPSPEVITAMENTTLGNIKSHSKSEVKRNTTQVLSEVSSGIDISSLNGMGPDAYQRQNFDGSTVSVGGPAEQFIAVESRADSRIFDYSSNFSPSGSGSGGGGVLYGGNTQTQHSSNFPISQTISGGYGPLEYPQASNAVALPSSTGKSTYYSGSSIPLYGQGTGIYSSEQSSSNLSSTRYAFQNGNSPSNSTSSTSINTSFSNPTPLSHTPSSSFTPYSTTRPSSAYCNNSSSNTLFGRNAKDSLLATDIGIGNALSASHTVTSDQSVSPTGVPLGYAGMITPLPRKQLQLQQQQQAQDHYFAQQQQQPQPQYTVSQQQDSLASRQTPAVTPSIPGVQQLVQVPTTTSSSASSSSSSSVRSYHTQVPLLPQHGQPLQGATAPTHNSVFLYPSGVPNAATTDVGTIAATSSNSVVSGLPSSGVGSGLHDDSFGDNPSPGTTTLTQMHTATITRTRTTATPTPPSGSAMAKGGNSPGILTMGHAVHSSSGSGGGLNFGSRVGTLSRGWKVSRPFPFSPFFFLRFWQRGVYVSYIRALPEDCISIHKYIRR